MMEMHEKLPDLNIPLLYPTGIGKDFQFLVLMDRTPLGENFGLLHKTDPDGSANW